VELITALQLLDGLRPLLPSTGSRQVEHAAAPNATSAPRVFNQIAALLEIHFPLQ
jgi:hypothetical protein